MNRLYTDLVALYPLVSKASDYVVDARLIRKLVRDSLGTAPRGKANRRTFLELGVGNGHVISHLHRDFAITAVDLSPDMLEHSRRVNPGVPHHVGDMKTLRLNEKFDVVLIHDAIHYMLSEADLLAAMTTARAHLKPGGLAIFMPCYTRETFIPSDVSHSIDVTQKELVGYVAQAYDPDPDDTLYVLDFMLFTRDEKGTLEVHEDRHTLGLFANEQWLRLLSAAGLEGEARVPSMKSTTAGKTPVFVGRLG
jgi:SAM-dependent methyltransferase